LSDSPDRRTVFCLAKKAVKKATPLRVWPKLNAPFQGGGQTRQTSLAQTMSAFTLEKPRPLDTRKRGFWSTNFNGQIVLMDYLIEKLLAANLFPDVLGKRLAASSWSFKSAKFLLSRLCGGEHRSASST
jgi:hypothetical protein